MSAQKLRRIKATFHDPFADQEVDAVIFNDEEDAVQPAVDTVYRQLRGLSVEQKMAVLKVLDHAVKMEAAYG